MKKSFLPGILSIILAFGAVTASAQTYPAPYEEKLLNGLKVLVWNDPAATKVTIKVRVHAGSAFDPKDKMGVMALLSDILFPDPQTYSYFTEDLEGKLEVTSNYDYIQIEATGKAEEFLSILDTLRTGLVNTPITQENFVKVRDARLARAKEEAAKPAVIADSAVARRLLGNFPYGRPMNGTPESLMKIDRFDLVTAREKFLDADNATLAIVGKVEQRYAVRAVKQMMGNWLKSDSLVPSTFAMPDPTDPNIIIVDTPGATTAEVRFAVRGLASNDPETPALIFWTDAFEKKINSSLPSECAGGVKVSHWSHALPGLMQVAGSFPVENAAKCYGAVKAVIAKADTEKVKPEDFLEIQKNIKQRMEMGAGNKDQAADMWLNAETFRWGKVTDQLKLINAATPGDGDKVAARIFWKSPVASAIVGDAAKIKQQFETGTVFGLTPEQDAQAKKDIADVLNIWKTALEKRDANAYLKTYAPKLETYYRDTNQDQSVVKTDIDKALAQFDSMTVELSKISVKPESETVARAIFDRRWSYRGKEYISIGAAQQELKLVKIDGTWRITGEKDLQVYSMDNRKIEPPKPVKPETKPR